MTTTTRSTAELRRAIDDVDARLQGIAKEARDLMAAAAGSADDWRAAFERMTPGQREANERYKAGVEKLLEQRDRLRVELREAQGAYIRAQWERGLADPSGGILEPGDADLSRKDTRMSVNLNPLTRTREANESAALRCVERWVTSPAAQDRLDRVIRDVQRDPAGAGAAYLAAVGSEHYASAFGQILRNPQYAHLGMSPDELDAVRQVHAAQEMRAGLGISGESGLPLPFTFDPTILPSDDGAISPLRSLARVVTVATNEYVAITAESVEATYEAEFSEVGDDTPTPDHPRLKAHKAQAWVEFSIEAGMDYPGDLAEQLRGLLAEGKANVEALKFVSGAGDNADEPTGILAGLAGTDSIVGGTFSLAALYSLQEALPPRFQGRARFLLNLASINAAARFVASGDTDEPQIFSGDGTRLLRKPYDELSTLPDDSVVYGDVRSGYTIVDRIGMTVELVPHILGQNRRPVGARGLYAFWRNGAGVVVPNALRAIASGS